MFAGHDRRVSLDALPTPEGMPTAPSIVFAVAAMLAYFMHSYRLHPPLG